MYLKMLFFFTAAIIVLSCSKEEKGTSIDPDYNIHFLDTFDYISLTSNEDAIMRIHYSYEHSNFQWGEYWDVNNVLSGQYEQDMYLQGLIYFDMFSGESLINRIWESSYQCINLCNLFFSETEDDSNEEVDIYKGEAHLYRALAYYTLIKYFGKYYPEKDLSAPGVPVITASGTNPATRDDVDDIYKLIIDDLDSAAYYLPELVLSENIHTKYAALALAAHTHVWFQEYDMADALLLEIFQSGYYQLTEKFSDNFDGEHENNSESIFEFQYEWDGDFGYTGSDYIPTQGYSMLLNYSSRYYRVPDDALYRLDTDPRTKEICYSDGDTMYNNGTTPVVNTSDNCYVKKYAHVMNPYGGGYGNNLVFIRLADLYLLHAEIQILKGNNYEAIEYINKVKYRAGADTLTNTGISGNELMEILVDERYKELFGEGFCWFDLIRWDRADAELDYRGFIRGIHEALPIPVEICDNNPGIMQNAGYW